MTIPSGLQQRGFPQYESEARKTTAKRSPIIELTFATTIAPNALGPFLRTSEATTPIDFTRRDRQYRHYNLDVASPAKNLDLPTRPVA